MRWHEHDTTPPAMTVAVADVHALSLGDRVAVTFTDGRRLTGAIGGGLTGFPYHLHLACDDGTTWTPPWWLIATLEVLP